MIFFFSLKGITCFGNHSALNEVNHQMKMLIYRLGEQQDSVPALNLGVYIRIFLFYVLFFFPLNMSVGQSP